MEGYLCSARKNSQNMKYRNGFLYVQNLNKSWRLVLPSTLNMEGKNFLEIAITETHTATANGEIKKIIKVLTDKFEYQFFFHLVKEHIQRYNICLRTKYT